MPTLACKETNNALRNKGNKEINLVKQLNDVRETIVYLYKIDIIQVDITRTSRRFSSGTSSKLFRVGQTLENAFIVFLTLNPEPPNPVGY